VILPHSSSHCRAAKHIPPRRYVSRSGNSHRPSGYYRNQFTSPIAVWVLNGPALLRQYWSTANHTHRQPAVGIVRIASCISASLNRLEFIHSFNPAQPTGIAKITKEHIAFGVNVGGDVMGNLPGRVAQPRFGVVRCGPDPDRAALIVKLRRLPEAHVVSSSRIPSHGFLESKILLSAPDVEIADGRGRIRPTEDRSAGNPDARTECDRIGWIPTGFMHRFDKINIRCYERDIYWIARNTGMGARDGWHLIERRVDAVPRLQAPRGRQEKIRYQEIKDKEREKSAHGLPCHAGPETWGGGLNTVRHVSPAWFNSG
jgi:hypothetical protein